MNRPPCGYCPLCGTWMFWHYDWGDWLICGKCGNKINCTPGEEEGSCTNPLTQTAAECAEKTGEKPSQ